MFEVMILVVCVYLFHGCFFFLLQLCTRITKSSAVLQGFAIPKEAQEKVSKFSFHGQSAELKHGSVVIAAITSCTNTSNPSVMLGAALVAKKACELGLQVSRHYMYCVS